MAGILIRDYATTAATFNSDDYSDIDGATSGTRKMLLSVMATRFGAQLATDGMVFGAGSAAAPKLAVGTAGNGIYASAANTLDVTTNGTRAMTVTSGQFVGIGVATPATALHVGTSLTTSPRGIMSGQYSTSTDGARFHMRKARGTEAAPTTVVTGDVLGKLVATGYDGSNYLEMASISLEATGTVAATRVPTRMVFATATNAAPSVLTDRMWLTENGDLGIGTSGPGKKLDINSATGACLQLTYNDPDGNATNKVTFDVSSGGDLTVAPSSGASNFTGSVNATGSIIPGNGLNLGSTSNRVQVLYTNGSGSLNCSGFYTFQGAQSTATGTIFTFTNSSTSSSTSATQRHLLVSGGFAPTSGTAVYNQIESSPTINQTGGASGITRGIYINPTVTAAADFRALEIATGKAVFGGPIVGGVQSLSGAGAVNVTQPITELTSTGIAQALTLADGVAGQEKTIIHGVDGGSMVLTPTTKTGFSTVTFTTAGESVTLVFLATRGWCVKSSYLAVIA